MKVRHLLLTMLSLFTAFAAGARGYTVTGTVTGSDGSGEPYATLRLYVEADTTHTVALGTADGDGIFALSFDGEAGRYRLTAQAVGMGDATREFTLDTDESNVPLGVISLGDKGVTLDEVSVTAQRPLVSREIDRIGYDVQADTDSETSPLSEILRKVPMVSVDPDGTIKVKGSTNFKIYKNGRPNKSFSSNAKDIFTAIPAASIKRIEVITDPGAREDAEGSTAILNIVTIDDVQLVGVTGSANLSWQSNVDVPTPNLWLMTQIGKVTVSAYGGMQMMHGKRSGVSSSTIDRTYTETDNYLHSDVKGKNSGDYGFWGAEGSWEPDTLNMVTFETSGFTYNSHTSSLTHTAMLDGATGDGIYSYDRLSSWPLSRGLTLDFGVNYQRLTHLRGEAITLSYLLSLQRNHQQSADEYTQMENVPFDYSATTSDSRTNFAEHTLQLDWTRPFGEKHTLDVGAKYIRRNNTARSTQEYVGWQDLYSDFSHYTDIAAIYGDYRFRSGRWGARAGVRYEYSRLSADFADGSQEGFGHSLNDVVPNAAVSYSASDASTFKLSYGGRINRPGIDYLNPRVVYSPTETSSGNPDLSSNYSHNVNLSYSLIKQRLSAEVSASYDFSSDGIDAYKYTVDDHTYSTYGNIGRVSTVSLSGFLQWAITDKTSWLLNAWVGHTHMSNSRQELSADYTSFNIWTRVTQQLPWGLRLSGSVWWANGNRSNVYSYNDYGSWGRDFNFSLSRSFLREDRLRVEAWVSNPWGPSTQKLYTYTSGAGYNDRTVSYRPHSRYFGVRVSFRFGSLNAQVKKTAASISNDDIVKSNNSGASK